MTVLTVGPSSSFPTIAVAMLSAGPNDTILLETGYSNETATVIYNGMIVSGDATSIGIVLQLALGVSTFTLGGSAPIHVLDSSGGNNIVGNAGHNTITVTDGADAANGGLGIDRLVVDYRLADGAVTGDSTSNFTEAGGSRLVTITNGTFEHFTVLTGSGADTITTGAGNDIINTGEGASTVTAGQGANSITGGSGADTVTALDGGNFIDGGNGTNVLTSGGGNDVIRSGVGDDTIVAGGGNDLITVRGGADTVVSGAGNDRLVIDYSALTTAVTGGVTGGNLATGYGGHIADSAGSSIDFIGTENFTIITGSGNDVITTGDGTDVLTGGAGYDFLQGGLGNDQLFGGSEADALFGNDGNDIVEGGAGSDSQSGGNGNDYVSYLSSNAGVTVNLATGVVSGGHATGDKVMVSIEHVMGSDFADTLVGSALGNGFHGNNGADVITGGGGPDRFYYNDVADSLVDPLFRDQITDFVQGQDMIDMRSMDASTIQDGNNNFVWRGTGAITTSVVGEVRYQKVDQAGTANDFTIIWADVDNDTAAEFAITLNGLHNLTSADFLM